MIRSVTLFTLAHLVPRLRRLAIGATLLFMLAASWAVPGAAHPGHRATPTADAAVTITAEDFAFDMPAELQAGYVTFTLTNNGIEDHHAQVLKLNDGVTGDDLLAALESDGAAAIEGMATLAGGPALTSPGEESTATVRLDAGNYIAICLVPSPDGMPHVAKGMAREFTVTGDVQGSEPVADETVTMRDFSFTAPTEVPAGQQTWQVINEGPQPHELVVRRLDDGVTFDQLVSNSVAVTPSTPVDGSHDHGRAVAPISGMTTAVGGVQVIAPGESGWFTVDLEPGTYVIICHVPDPATGKEHADLGMIQEATVT